MLQVRARTQFCDCMPTCGVSPLRSILTHCYHCPSFRTLNCRNRQGLALGMYLRVLSSGLKREGVVYLKLDKNCLGFETLYCFLIYNLNPTIFSYSHFRFLISLKLWF